jgi:hypothetical protein
MASTHNEQRLPQISYILPPNKRKMQITINNTMALGKRRKIKDKDKLEIGSVQVILPNWISTCKDVSRLKKQRKQKQIARYDEPPSLPVWVPTTPVKARPPPQYSVPFPPERKPAKPFASLLHDVPGSSIDPTHHILQQYLVLCRLRDATHHSDLLLG